MQQAAIGQGIGAAARRVVGPVALAAIALAVVLAAIGTYADRSDSDHHATREFLVVCAIIAIGAAVVFGWIVPKMLGRASTGSPALVLAGLGLVSVVVFWTGLPPILAAGGGLLGWAGRDAARGAGRSRAAVIADVAILVGDTTDTI
jgi:hypothetical protein